MYNNKMREFRKAKNITLKELSEETQVSLGYLCHLEKGTRTNPSKHVMEKIAKGLGEDIKDIFFK